ncbi:MAG: hypothetical protein RL129_192 [Actinomycetota bacterium]|jgi:hypothetical protein
MNSKSRNKAIILGIIATLSVSLLTACGAKKVDTNSAAWTQKQQERISRMWLPARSQECQNFITIFQNFNTIINERFASSSQSGVAQSIKDFKSFTSESAIALNQMSTATDSKSIKEYSKKFLAWINGLSKSNEFTKEKAAALLTDGKDLLYNPPYDCKNP